MRLYNKILTITMITFLAGFTIINLLTPDKNFSEAENRILGQRPSFTWHNLISGKFASEYERYITDQFSFRDFWVSIKAASEIFLQKKDNNGVYLGKDGYLLQKPRNLNEPCLKKKIQVINEFASAISPAPVYFLLAPNSIHILDDKLPPFAASIEKSEIKDQLSSDVHFVDVYSALKAHKNEYIYYKTDHHWTSLGAYYAYKEAGKAMDFTPWYITDFNIEEVTDGFYGTLYSKSGYRFIKPDSIHLFRPKVDLDYNIEYVDVKKSSNSLYERKHLSKKDKYSVFLDGNHALVKITGKARTGKKLLLLKDSYAHSFVPFLVNHYDEIHIIDLRYFNMGIKEYFQEYGLNEVLILYNMISFNEDDSIFKIIL